jgi:hypothetical protein
MIATRVNCNWDNLLITTKSLDKLQVEYYRLQLERFAVGIQHLSALQNQHVRPIATTET